MGDFAVIRVPHRASVIADVVAGAIQITAQFAHIGAAVTAMAARMLSESEQLDFARTAYEIRWSKVDTRPVFLAEKLLETRRAADDHPSLWHVFNRCQEAAMAGGVVYHSHTQRLVRTRRIRNIREDVRVNTALWQAAVRILESLVKRPWRVGRRRPARHIFRSTNCKNASRWSRAYRHSPK